MQHLRRPSAPARVAGSQARADRERETAGERQARERRDEHDEAGDAQLLHAPSWRCRFHGWNSAAKLRSVEEGAAATAIAAAPATVLGIDDDNQRHDAERGPRRRRAAAGAAAGARTATSPPPAKRDGEPQQQAAMRRRHVLEQDVVERPRCRWCRCRPASSAAPARCAERIRPDARHGQQRHGRDRAWHRGSRRPGGRRPAARPRS